MNKSESDETPPVNEQKRGVRLEDVGRKPEDAGRWETIVAGRHPDTNEPLGRWNESTLRPIERRHVRMQRELDAADRMQRMQRDLNIARFGVPYPSSLDRMRERDQDVLSRLTNELGKLKLAPLAPLMESEATRMLGVYGPGIAEHTGFLGEYRNNLGLFHDLSRAAFERADLLARWTLPTAMETRLEFYEQENVRAVRAYAEAGLSKLESDFERDHNPVFAWEAIAMAKNSGIDIPNWVANYLADAANEIVSIHEEVAGGSPASKEADRVGRVLGFGAEGKGATGQFKRAAMLEFDRNVFSKVNDLIGKGEKLDFAYDDVAKELNVSRSAVVQSYQRIRALTDV